MPWEIDPHYTSVEFSVKHLMIAVVKGRFPQVSGTFHLDPQHPTTSWVKAQIKMDSIYTGFPQRDAHLRSADFFEAVKYPISTFESTEVKPVNSNSFLVQGNLSLHGVTRPVQFQAVYTGMNRDPYTEAYHAGFAASTTINRRDFGITFNQINKEGIILIGYDVLIEIHLEAAFLG